MLTPQEKQIVEYGKKSGKTLDQSLQAVAKYRTSIRTKPQEESGFFEDLGQDFLGIGRGIKDVVTRRGEHQREILEADARGKQRKASSIFQTATNLALAPLEVGGEVIKGAVKAILPQEAENKIKSIIASGAGKVLSLPQSQQLVENYEAL